VIVGLRFKGKNLTVAATLFAEAKLDGSFSLGGIMEKPGGNFALNLPAGSFPVGRELKIPGDRRVDSLNDLGELMFVVGGEPWTVADMTIHALRLEGDRLNAKITLHLRRDGDGAEEIAVLTFKNEVVSTLTDEEIKAAEADVPKPREDTFDLREGLGRLRWGDDRVSLERNVYASEWRNSGSAMDPLGRKARWPAGLEIPTFLMIFKGGPDTTLWFSAFVRFGKDKLASGLTLYPQGPEEAKAKAEMLVWISKKLGLKPGAKKWSVKSVDVTLDETEKGFVLILEREH
jgi:hypothetical protein